jgi:hypothetical protein
MQSKATTVGQYLAELPADRRTVIEAVRKVILANLDRDYEEGMQYGMIGYYVPHRIYPAGYHCDPKQPLPFTALASQKNYLSLYLGCVYCGDVTTDKWFQQEWAKTGKKLDMGKSCIRFKKPEDLALDVIGEAIRRSPAKLYIEQYESVIKKMRKRSSKDGAKAKGGRKVAAKGKKPARKRPARTAARRAK